MERPRLVSFLHMLPDLDGDFARADLLHANSDERHETNLGVVRLEDYDGPRSHGAEIAPRAVDRSSLPDDKVRRVEAVETGKQGVAIVGSLDVVCVAHRPRDRRVPAVVRLGGKESLEHSAVHEGGRDGLVAEHVDEGVGLALGPELVAQLHSLGRSDGPRFAGADDDVVVIGAGDWPEARPKLTCKEVWREGRQRISRFWWILYPNPHAGAHTVPRVETIMIGSRIALEDLLESARRVERSISRGGEGCENGRCKPVSVLRCEVAGRVVCLAKDALVRIRHAQNG